MTVRGDLAASLVSKGKTWDEAKELVAAILDCADDPNFAARFATERDSETEEVRKIEMSNYWNVIHFLKWTME